MLPAIHVFRCETGDLYGLTVDHTGANLPTDECQAWQFVRTVQFEGGLPPWGLDVASEDRAAAVQAALTNNGFFIGEASALPAELT